MDWRLKGPKFEPHGRHCVVSLSKTHLSLLSTGSTQEDQSRHNWKIIDWVVKNQIKANFKYMYSDSTNKKTCFFPNSKKQCVFLQKIGS